MIEVDIYEAGKHFMKGRPVEDSKPFTPSIAAPLPKGEVSGLTQVKTHTHTHTPNWKPHLLFPHTAIKLLMQIMLPFFLTKFIQMIERRAHCDSVSAHHCSVSCSGTRVRTLILLDICIWCVRKKPHRMCTAQEMHHVHSCPVYFLQPVSVSFPPTYVKIDGTGPRPQTWFSSSSFTHYKLSCSSGRTPQYPDAPASRVIAFFIGSFKCCWVFFLIYPFLSLSKITFLHLPRIALFQYCVVNK